MMAHPSPPQSMVPFLKGYLPDSKGVWRDPNCQIAAQRPR